MSGLADEADEIMMCCADCGIAGVDDIKLKECTACKSVRYCSVNCQREHRPKHKRQCKKRAAELRDEMLFKQPESSHLGDCPICCLPLFIDESKSTLHSCCSKLICQGCDYFNKMREEKQRLEQKCPFCRQPAPETDKEIEMNLMKRVEANDPFAIGEVGTQHCREGDYKSAFEYLTKAAQLGDIQAHYHLSVMYSEGGEGVEKDKKKQLYHLEEAAIGGHPDARYNLGVTRVKVVGTKEQ